MRTLSPPATLCVLFSTVILVHMLLEQAWAGYPRLVDTSMPGAPDRDYADSQRDAYDRAADNFVDTSMPQAPDWDRGHSSQFTPGSGGPMCKRAYSNARSCKRAWISSIAASIGAGVIIGDCVRGNLPSCLLIPLALDEADKKAAQRKEACEGKALSAPSTRGKDVVQSPARSTSRATPSSTSSAVMVLMMRNASRTAHVPQ